MGVAALWFIGLLIVIVDIAATVDVIRRPDLGGGAKVFWVLLIFILPVVGVIAYVIARPSLVDFGENRDDAKKAASEAAAERARDRARDLGPTET
jgi:hypothetical protein